MIAGKAGEIPLFQVKRKNRPLTMDQNSTMPVQIIQAMLKNLWPIFSWQRSR